MNLDDYTLAAYLSGEIDDEARHTVAAALVTDREAREILHLACEALAAALQHDPTRRHLERHANRTARPGKRGHDRLPLPRAEA